MTITPNCSASKPGGDLCAEPETQDPTQPSTFAHPEHPLGLGWPFAHLADVLLRWADARDREFAATARGDLDSRQRATLDKYDAEAQRQQIRDHLKSDLLLRLRIVLEDDHGGEVRAALREMLGLTELEARVDQHEERIEQSENAIVALNCGEVLH